MISWHCILHRESQFTDWYRTSSLPLSLFFSSHGFFKEKLSPTISSTRDASQQLAPPGPSTLWCRMVLIMIKPRLVPTSWRRTILQRPTFFPMLIVLPLIDHQNWCVITNNPSHVSADTYTPILLCVIFHFKIVQNHKRMLRYWGHNFCSSRDYNLQMWYTIPGLLLLICPFKRWWSLSDGHKLRVEFCRQVQKENFWL